MYTISIVIAAQLTMMKPLPQEPRRCGQNLNLRSIEIAY
jgi:hypothetical protein